MSFGVIASSRVRAAAGGVWFAQDGNAGGGGSRTLDATPTPGNLLVIRANFRSPKSGQPPTPPGWTEAFNTSDSTNVGVACFYRLAEVDDPAEWSQPSFSGSDFFWRLDELTPATFDVQSSNLNENTTDYSTGATTTPDPPGLALACALDRSSQDIADFGGWTIDDYFSVESGRPAWVSSEVNSTAPVEWTYTRGTGGQWAASGVAVFKGAA